MHKEIIIVGAGENGNVAANCLHYHYKIRGFLDDAKKGSHILGTLDDYEKFIKDFTFFVSIGDVQAKKRVFTQLKKNGAQFINAIHPTAIVEKGVVIGKNVFIGAKVYINVNSQIHDNTIINNVCCIEHDTAILANCHLTPGVITGGGVRIGESTFIGLGAIINDHISIGDNVIIGSGSVVTKDIPSNSTAVGIPAKIIKTQKHE